MGGARAEEGTSISGSSIAVSRLGFTGSEIDADDLDVDYAQDVHLPLLPRAVGDSSEVTSRINTRELERLKWKFTDPTGYLTSVAWIPLHNENRPVGMSV